MESIKLYALFQAEKLGERGIGLKYYYKIGGALTIFLRKEDADAHLAEIIKYIKSEQAIGARSADNLDPKEKLDFYVAEVILSASKKSKKEMKERGWDFKKAEEFKVKIYGTKNPDDAALKKRTEDNQKSHEAHEQEAENLKNKNG